MVVVLGGERAAERVPADRLITEQSLHQRGEVEVSQPGDVRSELPLKLGDLRAAGILTDAEFEAKKTELLRRI